MKKNIIIAVVSILVAIAIIIGVIVAVVPNERGTDISDDISNVESEHSHDESCESELSEDESDEVSAESSLDVSEDESSIDDVSAADVSNTEACEHEYKVIETLKAATCTEDGSEKQKCELCGEEIEVVIEKLGHTFDKPVVIKAATCTEKGLERGTCKVCGAETEQVISATGHSLTVVSVTKEATCTEAGSQNVRCSKCGYTGVETIKATGHKWDSGTVKKMPSVEEEGLKVYICNYCGIDKKESIPKIVLGSNEKISEYGSQYPITITPTAAMKACKHSYPNFTIVYVRYANCIYANTVSWWHCHLCGYKWLKTHDETPYEERKDKHDFKITKVLIEGFCGAPGPSKLKEEGLYGKVQSNANYCEYVCKDCGCTKCDYDTTAWIQHDYEYSRTEHVVENKHREYDMDYKACKNCGYETKDKKTYTLNTECVRDTLYAENKVAYGNVPVYKIMYCKICGMCDNVVDSYDVNGRKIELTGSFEFWRGINYELPEGIYVPAFDFVFGPSLYIWDRRTNSTVEQISRVDFAKNAKGEIIDICVTIYNNDLSVRDKFHIDFVAAFLPLKKCPSYLRVIIYDDGYEIKAADNAMNSFMPPLLNP